MQTLILVQEDSKKTFGKPSALLYLLAASHNQHYITFCVNIPSYCFEFFFFFLLNDVSLASAQVYFHQMCVNMNFSKMNTPPFFLL